MIFAVPAAMKQWMKATSVLADRLPGTCLKNKPG